MATKPTAAQKAAVAAKGLAARTEAQKVVQKVNTVQTTLSSVGLGDATKKAQQALSEKYGIPTFDIKGNISTVPVTRPLDTSIPVGTGNLTDSAFKKSLDFLIQQQTTPSFGGSNAIAAITAPITALIETLFPKLDLTDLTDEQRKTIQGIDDQIKELNRQIGLQGQGASQGDANAQIQLSKLAARVDELERTKADLLRRYRGGNNIIKEINEQIKILNDLAKQQEVTQQLKDNITLEIQNASALIEKVLRDGLEIPKATITELNKAQLAANNKFKEDITKMQDEKKKDVDILGDFLNPFSAFFEALSSIFNPPMEDRIDRIVKDNRAAVEAYKRLAGK